MDSGKVINVGVVGYGFSAKVFHIPLINCCPGMKLVSVLERSSEKSAADFPGIMVVKTIDEMLSSQILDLVVITSVNSTHYPYAMAAIKAGKNVIVEKPFTISHTEAAELAEAARKHNVVLSVYHNRRFDSDFLTIKKLIESKALGQVVEIETRFDRFRNYKKNPNAWRESKDEPGSGILFDLGPHLIDQIVCLFGTPETVFAQLSNQRLIENGPDDVFHLVLGYPKKNFTAIVGASMLARIKPPRFRIFGTNGSFVKYGLDVQEGQLIKKVFPGHAGYGVEDESIWGTLDTDYNGLHFSGKIESSKGDYLAYYENVRDSILGKAELLVSAEQAAVTVLIIEKAFESAKTNTVVTL
ncbi:putative oxidoreductase YdgJ [Smittium mucronatum]|uniref:Putative oxidoreductase YdgJ n=1 Tax=Smittium mucronatum TaxID=133383 RepID=A0A1R0GMJ2_9FUNG|nr:putative oxidoreductase YdgJ [Smittium mucronatum]